VCSQVSCEFVACLKLIATEAAGEGLSGNLVSPFVLGEISCGVVCSWTFAAKEVTGILVVSEVVLKVVLA
jgi:hypothetical protein